MSYALVTGASKGIGKAITYNLAARKFNLLLVARSEDLLKEISIDLSNKFPVQVKYLPVDLADENAAEMIYEWTKKNNIPVNILVNNAGYGLSGGFEKYSAADHAEMMHVNMISLVKLTSLFLPMLKQRSNSYILNIASNAAYQAVPYLSTYAASKSFVVSFSRALQYETRKTKQNENTQTKVPKCNRAISQEDELDRRDGCETYGAGRRVYPGGVRAR